MGNSIGAYQADGLNDIGAYEAASGGSLPVGVPAAFSGGSAVTAEGAILAIVVAADYAEQAGDVYIRGARHDASGYMYVTTDVPGGSEVFVNGIAHSNLGVRYIQATDHTNDWPEGFASDANGAQYYMVDSGTIAGHQSGIGRDSDGGVLLNS
jgi:hypothetical protein